LLRSFEFLIIFFRSQLAPLFTRFPKLPAPLSMFVAALIIFSPLVWMLLGSFAITTYNTNFLFTGDDDLRLVDVQDADQVRTFIAAHVTTDDLVLGSPVLIWGLPTMHRADFLTAIAYNRQVPENFIGMDKTRFTMDLSLHTAKYVILDPLAEEFAPIVIPDMDAWLDEIHQWPIVFEAGEIRVYERE